MDTAIPTTSSVTVFFLSGFDFVNLNSKCMISNIIFHRQDYIFTCLSTVINQIGINKVTVSLLVV